MDMLSKGLTIRDMREDDVTSILQVWEETGMGGSVRGDNAESIRNTLNHGGRLLVMLYREELVGTSWITSDGRRLYLHHFGIRKAFQGRGWAKYLLAYSLEWAKQKEMQIKLEVHRNNNIAVNLYKKAGFAYLGDYDVYIIRDVKEIDPFEFI